MPTLKELLVAEATEYEFKAELEVKRPKSWLKTVSAFANGLGGRFFFGVDDGGIAEYELQLRDFRCGSKYGR
jgi:predicted HTH transcriptional regulator